MAGILGRLDRHETTAGAWLLKGGSAINLLHLDVPRLSVDIDLNYVGAAGVEAMRSGRDGFERALVACCEREGCTVKRSPAEHAGGKFRLRYASVLGGTQNLEVDVSYVARVPLWGMVRAGLRFPPDQRLDVPTLTLEELAAGKLAALAQRGAARDVFDAASLLDLAPDLLSRPELRIAFVTIVAGSRSDARRLRPPLQLLAPGVVARDLEPLLRRGSSAGPRSVDELERWLEERVASVSHALLAWSEGERLFLDRLLDEGEIDAAALTSDAALQDRILAQPMLRWKAQNVREYRGIQAP